MTRAAALSAVVLLAGCPADDEPALAGSKEGERAQNVAERVTTAVPRAAVQTELALLRGALKNHQRLHGGFPADLDDLEPAMRLGDPAEYEYEPSTGAVRSRSFPDL